MLDRVKPLMLVLLEGEIWPHVLRECRRRGVRTAIVSLPDLGDTAPLERFADVIRAFADE